MSEKKSFEGELSPDEITSVHEGTLEEIADIEKRQKKTEKGLKDHEKRLTRSDALIYGIIIAFFLTFLIMVFDFIIFHTETKQQPEKAEHFHCPHCH